LTAAECIIDNEISQSTEPVLAVIRKSLAEISSAETVTVRVNPAEVEAVEEGRGFWQAVNSQLKDIKIETDGRVAKGGCMVESAGGSVDARIETQLKAVRELFLKHWKAKGSTP
jgi:flagellar biosynthesis/type III secretory pathway protein FliH